MATASVAGDEFYKMNASPKGICLIINNFKFVEYAYLPTGPADKENLTRTFGDLDFDVRYFENLTCEEMKEKMTQIRDEDHSQYDCFVCCISSHGGRKGVCGSDDSPVNITELQSLFYARQCVSLAGKPKIFFIDCCRGKVTLHGHIPKSAAPANPVKHMISDKVDFLLCFAATEDNKSWCNLDSKKGSVFFYHLTRLLELHAKSKTVTMILKLLNKEMAAERPVNELQTAEYRSTLANGLRFYDPATVSPRRNLAASTSKTQTLDEPENNVLRILLVGKKNSGKTTLGNVLLNIQDCREQLRVGRGTIHCEWRKKTRGDNSIEVVDTPGLCDPNIPEEIIYIEVLKSVALCHPGPHVIVFTTRCDRRVSMEEFQAYQEIKKLLGPGITDYLMVVLNGLDSHKRSCADQLDLQRQRLSEEMTKVGGHLESILSDASGRYFGMDNRASPALREQQACDLIGTMQDLVKKNRCRYYTMPETEIIT